MEKKDFTYSLACQGVVFRCIIPEWSHVCHRLLKKKNKAKLNFWLQRATVQSVQGCCHSELCFSHWFAFAVPRDRVGIYRALWHPRTSCEPLAAAQVAGISGISNKTKAPENNSFFASLRRGTI